MYSDLVMSTMEAAKAVGAEYELPKVKAPPTAKWRLVSAMQKCIRRNNKEDLTTMIMGLRQADRAYMFRRMAVTALEDVGVMLPISLLECLFVMQRAAGRKDFEDPAYDVGLALLLADCKKDRSMCDSMVATAWHKDIPVPSEMTTMQWPVHHDPMAYVRLGWFHLGAARLKHPRWEAQRHEVPKFLQFLESIGISEEDRQMSARILGAGFEGFGLTYAIMKASFAYECKNLGGVPPFKDDDMHEVVKIGAYPSYTFDVHTQEGKRAYGYFLAMKDVETVKRLDKIEDKAKRWYAMDGVAFFGESDRMTQRVQWTHGLAARDKSMQACVPYPDYKEMVAQMGKDLPMLNYARNKVIKF